MSLLSIFSSIILIINFSLGFLVYFTNRKNRINQLFLLLILGVGIWMTGIILIPMISGFNLNLVLLVGRVPFFGASLLAIAFLFFSQLFPRKHLKLPLIINIFFSVLTIALIYTSLGTKFIIEDMVLTNGIYEPSFGTLYPLWGLLFLSIMLFGMILLGWKYKITKGIERIQIKYFFIGAILSTLIAITTNLLIPLIGHSSMYWQFGPFALIFLVIFTSFAITKHHLFNIRVILTEVLVSIVSLTLLIDLMLSKSTSLIILKSITLLAFIYLGISLIKSVLKEIKRREQLEKLTRQLEEANISLKKLDKAKSEFVSIASHQLRTPLTAIKGYISMAIEGVYGKFDDRFSNILKSVYSSNEELINLVNDLLNLSRIEAGKIKLEPEKVDLPELISQIINKLKINSDQKGLEIIQEPMNLPLITMDRDKMRQVLLNLIDNAIKYTQQGKITISAQKKDREVIVRILDTGMGISQEEMSNLFISFRRGESGPKFHTEGSGLGLYIAKKFIDMHKGRIWAESEGKGKGSSFFISLPC